jgi:uncharacterized protein (TIGR01777 family)
MRITLTGATGFIGTALTGRLNEEGHQLRILTRNPGTRNGYYGWNPLGGEPPPEPLAGAGAVIHLAGEPVAQRWTPEAKRLIRESRVTGTRHLVQALSTQAQRPEVLICASAVGYYGDRGDEDLTEESPAGGGFLPETCLAWEEQARLAESLGIRVVRLRIGIVLGGGGALAKMLPPFRAGLGGPLGGGRQWMPWIHIEDLVRLVLFALANPELRGAVNAVSPSPVRNSDFGRALGAAIRRPAVMPVPAFALKLLYGEMADLLLDSQKVRPAAAQKAGFSFTFNDLQAALKDLLK